MSTSVTVEFSPEQYEWVPALRRYALYRLVVTHWWRGKDFRHNTVGIVFLENNEDRARFIPSKDHQQFDHLGRTRSVLFTEITTKRDLWRGVVSNHIIAEIIATEPLP